MRNTGAMTMANELAALFRRDLTRLVQELQAFPDQETLWEKAPGISNSAGNLTLHLEGNLRDFVGRQLGDIAYQRKRDDEFGLTGFSAEELVARIEEVKELVPRILSRLSAVELEAEYPQKVLGAPISTQQFLIHIYGHFNYHLGQIDYLRRLSTKGTAVAFAGL